MDLETLRSAVIGVTVLNGCIAAILFSQRQYIPGTFNTLVAIYGVWTLLG